MEAYLKVIEHPGLVSHFFSSAWLPKSVPFLLFDLFLVCCVPLTVIRNSLKELRLGIYHKIASAQLDSSLKGQEYFLSLLVFPRAALSGPYRLADTTCIYTIGLVREEQSLD